MGEPLKNQFDRTVPRAIAEQVEQAWSGFDADRFLKDVFREYDSLELMDRGRAIARALRIHLPPDYPAALEILMRSIREPHKGHNLRGGMSAFYYHPHTTFVAMYGLEHFEISMRAQHELTQLFSAEFSIRSFIDRHEQRALALLREWTGDPSEHVRRLVSEGTRPRLPWGSRLHSFQKNPRPVLELLDLLKDDSSLYVRRSVANNLNDTGKDHPDILIKTARRWMKNASDERRSLVKHALRSLVKQGNPSALEILGFGNAPEIAIEKATVAPKRVRKGGRVTVSFNMRSTSRRSQVILVDLRVHYRKASGASAPKVFKLRKIDLPAGGIAAFHKTIALSDLTTRKHYAGFHAVDVLVNGRIEPIGTFHLYNGG